MTADFEAFEPLEGWAPSDLLVDPEEYKRHKTEARAIRQSHRAKERRAFSEESLDKILPRELEMGDSWHIISGGNVDSLTFLRHMVRQAGRLDYVLMSTWCMAGEDCAEIERWIDGGQIARFDAYCGEIFPNQYRKEHADLCRILRKCNGRVAIFRNHAKIYAGAAGLRFAIESSANVNTNPRTEQTAIHLNNEIYEFYKSYFDGITSFLPDFDEWKPWSPA